MALIRTNAKAASVMGIPYCYDQQADAITPLVSGVAKQATSNGSVFEFNLFNMCSSISITTDMAIYYIRNSNGTLTANRLNAGTHTITDPQEVVTICGVASTSHTCTVTATF